MEQLPWHDYAGQSADELFRLIGSWRTDALTVAFETALEHKAEALGLAALSQPECDVLAVEALEREVNNGGYSQFFENSSSAYAVVVVDALRRIGCPATAAITERAIAAVGVKPPLSAQALAEAMEEDDDDRDDVLADCDEAYCESGEDIALRLLEYLVRHREEVEFTP